MRAEDFVNFYLGNYPDNQNHWSYDDGCVLQGAKQMYEVQRDRKYAAIIERYMKRFIGENGSIMGYRMEDYNLDSINNGKLLFYMYDQTGEERYFQAICCLMEQLHGQPRCKCGNFFHKKIYPFQVWLDGLYMAQPFYMQYEINFHESKDCIDILNQFRNVQKYMYVEEKGLCCHGWNESKDIFWADKETGRSLNFWSRSLGWYLMALVDVMDCLKEDRGEMSQELSEYLKTDIDGLLQYQDPETKLFFQVIDRPDLEENYTETSGSAMAAYAILKGCRLGALPREKYESIGLEIMESLSEHKLIERDGVPHLEDTCMVAGLGPAGNLRRDGSVEYYLSEPRREDDAKGVGAFIMAYAEYLKDKN